MTQTPPGQGTTRRGSRRPALLIAVALVVVAVAGAVTLRLAADGAFAPAAEGPLVRPLPASPAPAEPASSSGSSSTESSSTTSASPPKTSGTTRSAPGPEAGAEWTQLSFPFDYAFASPDNFGIHGFGISQSDPNVLYVGTSYRGVWRTNDGGATWFKLNSQLAGSSDPCANLESGRNWIMEVDPTDPDIAYTTPGYGCLSGLWKTTNGGAGSGARWVHLDLGPDTVDYISSLSFDPEDHNHLLLAQQSAWPGSNSAGILESKDGGTTWVKHQPAADWGPTRMTAFLDSQTWIIGTEYGGMWRTTDSGKTWSELSVGNIQHGGAGIYRSPTSGWVYITGHRTLHRSKDNGATWTVIKESPCNDGYSSIIGDGEHLFAAVGNAGKSSCDHAPYFEWAPEHDDTNWSRYNSQTFINGGQKMVYDPVHRVVYANLMLGGVWKLQLP